MLYQTCFQRGFEILKKKFIFKIVRQFKFHFGTLGLAVHCYCGNKY